MSEEGTKLTELICEADAVYYRHCIKETFRIWNRYDECVTLYGEPTFEWNGGHPIKVFDRGDGTYEWFSVV